MFNLKFGVKLTRKQIKLNRYTQRLSFKHICKNPLFEKDKLKLQVWYSDEIKRKKNRENERDEIIKWIKELIRNSWQTILEMLRTGSCRNSNGLLSLFLYFVVKTMFYISPWFPRAPLPLPTPSDGLCSGGLCVFLAVQIYRGSRGYTGREGGRGRRVCLYVCVQWKDTCSNSRFKGRLILNTRSTLIIIIYFCWK